MQFRHTRSLLMFSTIFIVLLSTVSLVPLMAQDTNTVITIGIEEFQQQFFDDDAFIPFEEANPGVDVVTVVLDNDSRYFGSPQDTEGIPEFLENISTFASQADVLPLDFFNGPRFRTRGGAFLDLTPLISADADANLEDFYPAVLESVQWDSGTWGIPMSASVQILAYDRNAFDEAGLAYPDDAWTLDDFINAGEVLTEFDNEGNITLPGFFGFDPSLLFASLIDGDLTDPNSFPSLPILNTPENVALVEEWAAFDAEYSPNFNNGFNFDFQEIPLQITGTFIVNDQFNNNPEGTDFVATFLPGGKAGLQVQAYGVSSGTSNPQLAYELLQYMSSTPELAYAFFGDFPARQSLASVDTSDLPIFRPEFSPEVQELIDEALANSVPPTNTHYTFYLGIAASQINSPESTDDAATYLQNTEDGLREVLMALDESTATSVIEVATPVPTPVLQSGQVSLNFGITSTFGPGPDRDLWEDAIADFIAQDPQVGQILLDSGFYTEEERAERQDCYYASGNPVISGDLSQYLPVGPYLSTDSNLDINTFVNGTIAEVTRDNTIWGMPLSLNPLVMLYNPNLFDEAGISEPTNDWNITEFVEALRDLDTVTDTEPFSSTSFGGGYLYLLIEAYGGQAISLEDGRYVFDLDSPETIEAIRQVMSLVDAGLINYRELATFSSGGFSNTNGITDFFLTPSDFRLQERSEDFAQNVVMFPRGANSVPVSYGMSVGIVLADTPAPEACYRWLSFISRRAELLDGMPAQSDLFEASMAEIDNSEDIVELYGAFNEALNNPQVSIVPSPFNSQSSDPVVSATNFVRQNWLNAALDAIATEGADIETELTDAQQFLNEFEGCIASIAPPEMSVSEMGQEEQQSFFIQYVQCAVDVDPSVEEQFGPILNQAEDDE